MGFDIKVCPSMVMRIIEFKTRVKDKLKVGVELNRSNRIDVDLEELMKNLDDLESTWKEQIGLVIIRRILTVFSCSCQYSLPGWMFKKF